MTFDVSVGRGAVCALLFSLTTLAFSTAQAETIKIPFIHYTSNTRFDAKFGWTDNFQNGASEEKGIVTRDGFLWAYISVPSGKGPFSFVILMHGCGGLLPETRKALDVWTDWFHDRGIGTLILDSFTSRSIKAVCGPRDPYWARRRTDDAYSALAYLVRQPNVLPEQVFLFGQSDGARAVLDAMQRPRADEHEEKFAGAISMYPSCADSIKWNYYAPMFVFIGGKDMANAPQPCRDMAKTKRPTNHPLLEIVEYPEASHSFDTDLPTRMAYGWLLKYDGDATRDVKSRLRSYFKALGNGEPK